MKPFIPPPAVSWIVSQLLFYKDDFGIKLLMKFDMLLNKPNSIV